MMCLSVHPPLVVSLLCTGASYPHWRCRSQTNRWDQLQSGSQIRGRSGNETSQTCSCGDPIECALELKMH